MARSAQEIRRDCIQRLEEIEQEAAMLKAILAVVPPPVQLAPRPARARKPRPSRRRSHTSKLATASRTRGRTVGTREQEALKLVDQQPGVTVSELAKTMGIKPNYLYRVLPRLEKEGQVTKQGKGYHLVVSPQ